MKEFTSYWRCDADGETYTITVAPVLLDTGGEVMAAATGTDFVIDTARCEICGNAMRRVVSPGDLRDWGHELV